MPPISWIITGIVFGSFVAGVIFGVFYCLQIVANSLLSKSIIMFEKRPFPTQLFPNGFDKHPYAVPALVEILNAEPGFHPLRAVLHRQAQKAAHAEVSQEIFAAKLAKRYNITRDRAGDAFGYLEGIGFVTIATQRVSRKKVPSLTDTGRQAAIWLEANYAPSLLSYLETTYPHSRLVGLLRGLREPTAEEDRSTTT